MWRHFCCPCRFRALEGTPLFTGEYNCTPCIYAQKPFACHAGDLTGKLGIGINASPDPALPDFRLLALDSHADNTCVASDNMQSLVVHCKSTSKATPGTSPVLESPAS